MGEKIVLYNANIINVNTSRVEKNNMLIIENDKIKYIGENNQEIINMHDIKIDINNKFIMPGMIDVHVHLFLEGEIDHFKTTVLEPITLTSIRGSVNAKKYLTSGYTTIRCLGEKGSIDTSIKKAINNGLIEGPRIIASGRAVTITGGHGDIFPNKTNLELLAKVADGPIEVKRIVREQIKNGADNIKFMASGGGMSPGPAEISQLTIEEMSAGVEEAEKFGKTTAAHCIGTESIKNALKAGVRTIEHGTFLDDEGIELLISKNAYLVPTLAAFKTIKYGEEAGVPKEHFEKVKYFATEHTKNLKKAIKAGVKIITGTDAGTPFNYHGDNAYELECLVDNGLSPFEAIKCTTKVAAEALKLPEVGSVEVGKIADVIVVNSNPLQDITILQNNRAIEMVIKEGKIVKNILKC